MPTSIAAVPALLLGFAAHILFDHFSCFDGPSVTDFILFGAWQGVALYYANKTSGFGVIVALGSATKLSIEFIFDVPRCITIVVGIALGVLFADFLYQHLDKPPHSSRRKKHQSAPTSVISEIKSDSSISFRPRESVETVIDDLAPNFPILSDITVVDSAEPEVHALRPGASFADSERRRFSMLNGLTANMISVSTNSHPSHQNDKEDQPQEQTASSSRDQLESQRRPEHGPIIGIDMGTNFFRIGMYRGRQGSFEIIPTDQGNQTTSWVDFRGELPVKIIPNDDGNRTTASWVGFRGDELLIGDSAKNSFHSNPKNTVFDVKRLIGRTIEEVKRDLKHLPFMVEDKNGAPVIRVEYKGEMREYAPEDISAMILTRMKEMAEAHLGHEVTRAVVTVPSYFNDAQRQATKRAGEIAGLKVLRVLNDPIAAALAYGLGKTGSESKLMVYGLGGGTFDVSLLSINEDVFKVLATAGDTHLGGEDFDNRVIDYLVKAYNKKTGRDVSSNQRAMSKLKKAVELAKRALSEHHSVKIEIKSFENGNGFLETLTRAKFEELNLKLFERTMKSVEQVLKDAEVTKSEIDEVVLVGGSTRIPKIQELLKDYFGKELFRDRASDINPDEAVAYGATIQAAILSGQVDISHITVLDINSFSLGIEVKGGGFVPIIKRGTSIPTKKNRIFSTTYDNQLIVAIQIFEGEREQTKFNRFLGEFKLEVLPRPKGVPELEVTFELDADSILTVRALDKETGNSEFVVITKDRRRLS